MTEYRWGRTELAGRVLWCGLVRVEDLGDGRHTEIWPPASNRGPGATHVLERIALP
jgi:hypothetical protein